MAPATRTASWQILFKRPTPAIAFETAAKCTRLAHGAELIAQNEAWTSKSGPIFTRKYASRHNGVHFLSSSTSQSAPTMRCFEHFGFEMRFPSQGRALFQHLNFQECCRTGVLCTFRVAKTLRLGRSSSFFLYRLTLPTSWLLNVLQLLVTAKD